jgi:hypothetical protein
MMSEQQEPLTILDDAKQEALLRWRLVLGRRAEEAGSDRFKLPLSQISIPGMSGVDADGLDQSMEFLYGDERGAGLDDASPSISRWLGDIRRYFPDDVVVMLQRDAIERRDLASLLFERETLLMLEQDIELAATILTLQSRIPDEVRETAREVVRNIVEKLKQQLMHEVRQTIVGALARSKHSVIPSARNLDWKRTIERNMKHYDPGLGTIVPERFLFWANERRFRNWDVIVCVDQSGSMTRSVVYSSIMAAIFASIQTLDTKLVFFSTRIADMTEYIDDPVEVLFGAQLGGGTDIARAVLYCNDLITRPDKTIFILITDLYEGGSVNVLLSQLRQIVENRVHVVCLLALDDSGHPAFNKALAGQVRDLGIPTLASTPNKLAELIGDIIRGGSVESTV